MFGGASLSNVMALRPDFGVLAAGSVMHGAAVLPSSGLNARTRAAPQSITNSPGGVVRAFGWVTSSPSIALVDCAIVTCFSKRPWASKVNSFEFSPEQGAPLQR